MRLKAAHAMHVEVSATISERARSRCNISTGTHAAALLSHTHTNAVIKMLMIFPKPVKRL